MITPFGAAILMCCIAWILLLLIASLIDWRREWKKKGRKDIWY